MLRDLGSIRQDYTLSTLDESVISDDPVLQFQSWFNEAVTSNVSEVNAMTLSTLDETNRIHSRIVLLKGIEENQFIFFTNQHSAKGKQLGFHPQCSLLFFWKELQRQVRVEGRVEKLSDTYAENYFASRPRESQLGAWASHQSEILSGRNELEDRYRFYHDKFLNEPIPKPPHWGGYALTPDYMEFWQGRSSRLHDRLAYTKQSQTWQMVRLNP